MTAAASDDEDDDCMCVCEGVEEGEGRCRW